MNEKQFKKHLENINIFITDGELKKLSKYYELLIEFNEKFNLTTIKDKEEVYLKHFYDSLTISSIIDLTINQKLCDIGTGAGFPGIVLKIVFPNLYITLVESNFKKCMFLDTVIKTLDLKDINIINNRAEEYSKKNNENFDIVVSRAVAPSNILLEYSIPLLKIKGTTILMKTEMDNELKLIKNAIKLLGCEVISKKEFILPIEESKRCLIRILKKDKTSEKYPRNYSQISKNPL